MKKYTKNLLLLLFPTFILLAGGVYGQTVQLPQVAVQKQIINGSLGERLRSLDGVVSVEQIDKGAYNEKWVVMIAQPIDYQHPEQDTFSQRFTVCHAGFDRPTVMVTEGYQAAYALRPAWTDELSGIFNANVVVVEHRYFDASTPDPIDWRCLTVENAMHDLHRINGRMKAVYPGKWISTGISKGGSTTIMYRAWFPNDVDISVPYVGPINFSTEDGRHEPFLEKVGTPAERKAVLDFQAEVLKRRAELMPMFKAHCDGKGYVFRVPLDEVYDLCVLEYSFSHWQWGTPIERIPPVTVSDKDLSDYFIASVDPDYFAMGGPHVSFYVQAAREFGYYGYDTRPFRDLLARDSEKDYLNRVMLPIDVPVEKFDARAMKFVRKYLLKNDPKMIFIYGETDPWTASGITDPKYFKGKQNMTLVVQPGGSHRTRINTLPEAQREELIETITRWLAE
ncbi:MAG: aminopeptidase [Rikenellaceae bacterium]|jgi:hypothetical protein|nr:aminopeptidase [Rikenellaceae bacterium]